MFYSLYVIHNFSFCFVLEKIIESILLIYLNPSTGLTPLSIPGHILSLSKSTILNRFGPQNTEYFDQSWSFRSRRTALCKFPTLLFTPFLIYNPLQKITFLDGIETISRNYVLTPTERVKGNHKNDFKIRHLKGWNK